MLIFATPRTFPAAHARPQSRLYAIRCCDPSVDPSSVDQSVVAGIEAFLSTDWEASLDDDERDSYGRAYDRFEQELKDEQSYPARAFAEQAFLGKGDPLEVIDECQSAAAAAAAVSDDGVGVVRLRQALSAPLAAELRAFALSELRQARCEQAEPTKETRLSNVLASADARWDVRLPMRSVVRRALRELLGEGSALGGALELLGGGRDAELWELSAMISSPGAAAQIVHADCDGAPNPPLLHTAFVALQPVTRALGPTRWLPATHSDAAAHVSVNAHGDVTVLKAAQDASPPLSNVGLLDTGDASLYDGRILHCGGANDAPQEEGGGDGLRVLFYMTFRHADAVDAEANPGARSLLARYDGRVSLGMLRDTVGGFDGYWLP
tara:strand:- start:453 stop:1595 length:1143 start_codon:yes stop_codon:yes gene_type:complete